MVDSKKLITGFLILATAATCSGLIFSFVTSSQSVTATAATQVSITGGGTVADESAFLPTESEVQEVTAAVAPDLASSTMTVTSSDSTNLTDNLAAQFVNGVVAANPSGPTGTDANGNPTFATPDVNAIATAIANSTTTAGLTFPNWNVEAASVPIIVVATSSSGSLIAYGTALQGIMNAHLNDNAQVQSIINDKSGDTDATDLANLESQIQGALQDASSLKVPAPAVAYQKSLISYLVYEKNLIQLYDVAQTDPVKASLIFQQENNVFYAVQMNFLEQAHALSEKTLSLQENRSPSPSFLSLLNNIFGIPEAQAQFTDPVLDTEVAALDVDLGATIPYQAANQTIALTNEAKDVAGDASIISLLSAISVQNIGQALQNLLTNTLLQILKNTLIAIIQREVLTWIQGSGAPRFITNWGTQLVNAAQTSALNAINSQMACGTYPAFIGQIKLTLNTLYQTGNNSCANQFAAALGSNSFQQFYNSFANGGFVAFGASTLPSGNPYGSLFFNAQTVALSYNNQQAATLAQTQTSQGLKGDQVCEDGSNPASGQHTMCESTMNNTNGPDYALGTGQTTCSAGFAPVVYDNNGLCANGAQPEVTTPAAATGFAFQGAIGATPEQVSAANDIVGVLNAVLNSLMTSLASTAVNAAGQLVNQSLSSLNAANITNGTAATAATIATGTSTASTATTANNLTSAAGVKQLPLACNPGSQTVPLPPTGTGSLGTSTASADTGNSTPTTFTATGGTLDSNGNPPIYYWSDSNGTSGTGGSFSDVFPNPGTYTATLTDSTGDAASTCTLTVQ